MLLRGKGGFQSIFSWKASRKMAAARPALATWGSFQSIFSWKASRKPPAQLPPYRAGQVSIHIQLEGK